TTCIHVIFYILLSLCSGAHRELPSFPTRRSSDLAGHVKAEAERAQAELDAFAGPLSIPADRRIARLVQDSVPATIHRVAADLRADLIVVGTHGRTGIERLMLGSVAAAILGLAQIDVLAVPTSTKG